MRSSVLLIDDDPDWLVFLGRLLDSAGFHIVPLSDSNKFSQLVEGGRVPDVVVTDLLMPGATASTVYRQVRELLGPKTPVIICTGTKMKVKVDDNLLSHVHKSNASTELVAEVRRLLAARPAITVDDRDLDLDLDFDLPSAFSEGSGA